MAFHDLANQDDHRDVNGLNSETRFQVFSFEKQVSVVDECQTFPHLAGSELSGDEFGFFVRLKAIDERHARKTADLINQFLGKLQ